MNAVSDNAVSSKSFQNGNTPQTSSVGTNEVNFPVAASTSFLSPQTEAVFCQDVIGPHQLHLSIWLMLKK